MTKATTTSTEESKVRFTVIVKKIFNLAESQYNVESSQIIYDNHHDMMEVLIGNEQSKLRLFDVLSFADYSPTPARNLQDFCFSVVCNIDVERKIKNSFNQFTIYKLYRFIRILNNKCIGKLLFGLRMK